ncbi:MAG: hypothetical protein LLF90_00565 [Methanomicrobiaceae archaeon]|nr:hypothetical protein [Methanomicrobiaceae archaeon]
MNSGPSSWRSPPAFFLLLFFFSVPFLYFAGTPLPGPLNLPASAFMIVCPALAASILVFREEGSGGVARLLARVVDYQRIRPIWFLPIISLVPAIMLLSCGVMLLSGRPLPADQSVPFATIPVPVLLLFIVAAGEEVGWMGYAADPLQGQRSALATALILGVVLPSASELNPLVLGGIGAGEERSFPCRLSTRPQRPGSPPSRRRSGSGTGRWSISGSPKK